MHKKACLTILSLMLASICAYGHESTANKADIGLEEKLGQYIPSNTIFIDERGQKLNLRTFIDKPTIIAPVYLNCTHECPLLLSGLAEVLGKLALIKPGKDYKVATLSFDDKDTPKIAAEKKVNYIKLIGKSFPEDSWKFLTGDISNIKSFTDAIGFKFQRDGLHEFSHPITLVILAPSGKIVRYIEGTTFLPFEITMALTEAAEGRVGSPARKALLYCFSYDPLKKSYVFNILQITGVIMILFVGAFLAYLLISTKKKKGQDKTT
ncbi:MAG TPA: SCO family protein [Nitrospirota bacterium]|nr:SCO family protein [Nitrospirota bacterium]